MAEGTGSPTVESNQKGSICSNLSGTARLSPTHFLRELYVD
jgi:hypothetical protein